MKEQPSTQGLIIRSLIPVFLIVATTVTTSAQAPPREKHPLIVPTSPLRFGDRSLESTIRTDERYGHDGLFQGPRGWVYWNYLENPKPIQNPNLWPDMRSTYFISRFTMPAGSSMTLRGTFPYARFFQFALYKFERNTFVAFGQSLRGPDIEPDSGSTNPFRVGANRLAENRNFTIHVLAEDPPRGARLGTNTLYVGREGKDIEGVIRIYLPDQDQDGTGWAPPNSPYGEGGFPTYECKLANGTKLSAEQFAKRFAKPFVGETTKPMTLEQWVQLVNAKDNDPDLTPQTAPARNPSEWERFTTVRYGVIGVFKSAAARAKIPFGGPVEGGGEGPYLVTYLSRKYGPVYVIRGKMPTFPDTYAGENGRGAATMPDVQTQYWSLVSCESVASGRVVDGLTDFQIPLDKDRNYTIVVSRPEDRPKNATLENGVAWFKWSPRGEGLDDPRNRADFGMLILRIMGNSPNWKQRPDNIVKAGTGAKVMGPYFPKGHYTTKEAFEARGSVAQAPKVVMTTGQGKKLTLTMKPLKKSRGYLYCELVFDYGEKGYDIYSTSPLAEGNLDWWNSLDLKALAREFGAKAVYKNGPQWWSMDEVALMLSDPVRIAGVNMVFGAHLPPGTLKLSHYDVFNPAKFQNLLWKAGRPVYQLVDPDGHLYVLQGHKIPVDQLATLGDKFKELPEGWKYRVKVYDEDLVMKLTPREPIPSVQDEFDQIYIRIPAQDKQTKGFKKVSVNNTRDMRFGEILVVKEDVAEIYNTTGLNDCPDELWEALDTTKLAKEFGAVRVQKNGPKYWMMDSQTVVLGETASFGSLEARLAGSMPRRMLSAEGTAPYKIYLPKKTQRMVYEKGKTVFELVDPEGHVYVLQAHGPQFTLETLPQLGERMKKLPQGWRYRTRTLTKDLVIDLTPDKTIYAVGDEFHQYYTRIPE